MEARFTFFFLRLPPPEFLLYSQRLEVIRAKSSIHARERTAFQMCGQLVDFATREEKILREIHEARPFPFFLRNWIKPFKLISFDGIFIFPIVECFHIE